MSIICLGLNSCAFLGVPWQVTAANTLGDVITYDKHGKTMNEAAASIALQKDCKWSRLFIGWPACLTQQEYLDELYKMNCEIYAWNFLNNPYCKENE